MARWRGGEAGGLSQAAPDRLFQRLVVVASQAAQIRHGGVVVEDIGSKRHRPAD